MSDILDIDSEIGEIAKRILVEIENATFRELTTSSYAKIMSHLYDVGIFNRCYMKLKRSVVELNVKSERDE